MCQYYPLISDFGGLFCDERYYILVFFIVHAHFATLFDFGFCPNDTHDGAIDTFFINGCSLDFFDLCVFTILL